jgi:membrane-associated protein
VGAMNGAKFFTYNLVGGFLWVTIFIWGGYLFGNVPLIKENFGIVTILIIVISVMPVVWELIRPNKPAGA